MSHVVKKTLTYAKGLKPEKGRDELARRIVAQNVIFLVPQSSFGYEVYRRWSNLFKVASLNKYGNDQFKRSLKQS